MKKIFPPVDPSTVDTFSMGGHEKVTVKVCRGGDRPARTGRPRKLEAGKKRRVKPYTCGWFMVTDPRSGRVLAVEEQKAPENNSVKIKCVKKVIKKYKNLNAIIHDRSCSLPPECERKGIFAQVKY